ncbi:MAG TPA: NIPSNAP family protein [Acidobacteriaceae bacterium]|nr:NIPSNAP family protein [Acidobacteriaceae bacterium]
MQRRTFLTTAIAAGALAAAKDSPAQSSPSAEPREYYQLRRYLPIRGSGEKLCADYFEHNLIPALNRRGINNVGVFSVDIGPLTPTLYVLLSSTDLTKLVNIRGELAKDDDFMKASASFWAAPASAPAYSRVESQLLVAFTGHPRLTPPPKGKRIFQLRTYESPTDRDHTRKIEMFHSGEFEIFAKAGARSVFYGDTLIGPRTPSLTYMLTFEDMAHLEDTWDKFRNDPDWKKLSADPRFSFEQIVNSIDNLVLHPADYSQI